MQDSDTWNYRSSGGEQDIADGYADLQRLVGTTLSSTIEEDLVYNLLTTGVSAVTVDKATFKKKITATGTYNFIYTPTITYSSALVYSLNKSTFAKYVSQATGTYTFDYILSKKIRILLPSLSSKLIILIRNMIKYRHYLIH